MVAVAKVNTYFLSIAMIISKVIWRSFIPRRLPTRMILLYAPATMYTRICSGFIRRDLIKLGHINGNFNLMIINMAAHISSLG